LPPGCRDTESKIATEQDPLPGHVEVVESLDDGPLGQIEAGRGANGIEARASEVTREALVSVLLGEPSSPKATEEQRYDAALALHELGTDEALRRLGDRPGHEEARAILRDARWDVPGAGDVPLLSARGRVAAIVDLVLLRSGDGLIEMEKFGRTSVYQPDFVADNLLHAVDSILAGFAE
jgi:hypothetical protein